MKLPLKLPRPDARALLRALPWLLLGVPALLQLATLLTAFALRLRYPYDLEWMEGGMLTHALQLSEGRSIYRPPSAEFIPFLYTPLYPAVLAALGKIFGLGYTLGRVVSILSTLTVAIFAWRAVVREAPAERRVAARVAALSGLGLLAATYPWVECFFDLVRGDMFFLALGVAGLYGVRAWTPASRAHGRFWDRRVALAAALLGVSFFAKQTGVLLVLAAGPALLLMNWRMVPLFAGVTAALGLGGSAILNAATDGWYWVYIFEVHQNHDTHMPRFWQSFEHILEHFPVMTTLVALGLVAVVAHVALRRRLPAGGAGLLYWAWLFACGTLIGAVGWATQWAVFNAFIPAMALGAIAAAAALVPLADTVAAVVPESRRALAGTVVAAAVLLLLAGQNARAGWDPRWSALVGDGDKKAVTPAVWQLRASVRPFVPEPRDWQAGRRLMARLRAVDGDLFYPSHPWYARLAGKRATFTHRIGVKDVTYVLPCQVGRVIPVGGVAVPLPCFRRPGPDLPAAARVIAGLPEAAMARRFGAVVLDDGEQVHEYPGLGAVYRVPEGIPGDARPRVFSGKPTQPGVILRPTPVALPAAPPAAPPPPAAPSPPPPP